MQIVSSNSLEILKIMDWIPIVFITVKVLVLGTGMIFAIKWHYDQGKKEKEKQKEQRAVLRAAGKVAAVFVLSLLGLGLATFALSSRLGLDLTLP
jgi:heme/copper-type cytochrome/quinol oxidase subunit 2